MLNGLKRRHPSAFYYSLSDVYHSIHQYFDGKCTDDEILHHADISRRQLREVLHHYDEYVSLFFHSSIWIFPFRIVPWARPPPITRILFTRPPPGNHVRGIRSLTLSKPLNASHMGYRGVELAHDYFDYLTSHPLDLPPSFFPVPCDSLAIVVPISESPLLLNCDPLSVLLSNHILGSTCSCSTASTVTGSMAFSSLGSIGPVFYPRSYVHVFPFAVTVVPTPVLAYYPAGFRTRLFASGSASCGTWTVCAGVC